MKRASEIIHAFTKEALETAKKRDLCVWFRGGDCGKGLPGTPCEMKGCVAWIDHLNQLEEKVTKYIGFPREIGEDSATYGKREAYKYGYLQALVDIKNELKDGSK